MPERRSRPKKTIAKKPTAKRAAEERTLSGIVRSVGGANIGGTDHWDLVVFLCPWRDADGPLVKKEVRLVVPVGTDAEVKRGMAEYRAGDAIAVAVTEVGHRKGYAWWDAQGSGPLRAADPAPFAIEVQRQSKVRTAQDDELGTLILNRRYGWYEAQRKIGRKTYSLTVESSDPDDDVKVRRALRRAAPRVLAVEAGWTELLDLCASELLATYNDVWRKGGRPLSAAGFKKHLALSSVLVAPGRTTLYIDCADLFLEHCVEVRIPDRGDQREVLISG